MHLLPALSRVRPAARRRRVRVAFRSAMVRTPISNPRRSLRVARMPVGAEARVRGLQSDEEQQQGRPRRDRGRRGTARWIVALGAAALAASTGQALAAEDSSAGASSEEAPAATIETRL